MIKKFVLWTLVILWAATIFSFSAQPATQSNKSSTGFTKKIVRILEVTDSLSEQEINKIAGNLNHFVRKGAHFCAYALLSVLVYILLKEYGFRTIHATIFAVSLSGLYACTDEFHQTFIEGRAGQIRDVGIDTLGAFFGVSVFYLCSYVIKKIRARNKV